MRVTGGTAKIRMTRFIRKLIKILVRGGIKTEEIYIYVDDLRLILKLLQAGTIFCESCCKFRSCPTQREQDLLSEETPAARTSRVLGQVMNSIEPELRFTTESCEDFSSGMLPTLDYQMWFEETREDHPNSERTHPEETGDRAEVTNDEPAQFQFPDPVPLTREYGEGRGEGWAWESSTGGPTVDLRNPGTQPPAPCPNSSQNTSNTELKKVKLKYLFFEKEISSKYCTLEHSAMSWNMKRAILSQEVIRRLLNTS